MGSAEVLQARQALIESKSPLELSEIHSLAEMPIPSRIEAWLHGEATASQEGVGGDSPLAMPRNTKELGEALYRGLPSSLTAPVVVRSKVEDPTVLIERQQLQQTKSIHELSKIRNLNELPIPGNVIRMPDVPLPKMKSILNVIARPAPRSSPRRTPKSETYKSFDPESGTVESTPLMDDRQLHSPDCPSEDRYEEISTSRTEEMDLPSPPPPVEEEVEEEEEDQFSLADQIRATPERSLKKEKKKKNRRSTDSEALSADSGRMEEDEIPPPLPPKRITPSPKKGLSLETQPSLEEEEEAVPVKGILSLQAVDFDQMMAQGPGAGAQIVDRPGRSSVKKSESGRRLQEGTEQLSMELMEHVESLKTTLDNMSSRLGTRSHSRSHSKSRHSSQYRPSEQ